MKKYIFTYNVDFDYEHDQDMIQQLDHAGFDYIIRECSTNGVDRYSIWIKQDQFIQAMQLLDDELTKSEIASLMVNRFKDEKYYYIMEGEIVC